MKTVIRIGCVALVGCAGYLYYRKNKKNLIPFETKTVDGILNFSDVLGYFKSKNLIQGKDIPFIAQNDISGAFSKKAHNPFPGPKTGYKTIVLGVYNEKASTISHCQVLYVKELDEKTKEVLGNEDLVVLQ